MANILVKLNTLPPELVDAILIYLPISAVIEISGKSPYMSDCLLQSPSWRHLFTTHERREALQRVYSLFLEFHELIYCKPFEHGSIHRHIDLILSYSHFASRNWCRRVDPVNNLYNHLEGFVKEIFQRVSKEQLERIAKFSSTPLDWPLVFQSFNFMDSTSSGFEDVRGVLRRFRKAEDAFNNAFSKRLRALANLLSKCTAKKNAYAGPSRAPRKNILPIIALLLDESVAFSKSRVLNLQIGSKYLENSHSLLSYDKSLAMILQVLSEHPPRRGTDGFLVFSIPKAKQNQTKDQRITSFGDLSLVDLLSRLSFDYDIYDLGKAGTPYSYPRNVAIDMWTVVDGLGLASAPDPEDMDLEAFWETPVPVYNHRGFDYWWSMDGLDEKEDDAAEMASQWLLAFLRCSAFCEETFPEIADRISKEYKLD